MDTFAVLGGDLRSTYLAGLLAEDGYKVIAAGFDSADLPGCVTGCTDPKHATVPADCVILPLPVTVAVYVLLFVLIGLFGSTAAPRGFIYAQF